MGSELIGQLFEVAHIERSSVHSIYIACRLISRANWATLIKVQRATGWKRCRNKMQRRVWYFPMRWLARSETEKLFPHLSGKGDFVIGFCLINFAGNIQRAGRNAHFWCVRQEKETGCASQPLIASLHFMPLSCWLKHINKKLPGTSKLMVSHPKEERWDVF